MANTSPQSKDRLFQLLQSTQFNGIDYVELVASDPTSLLVHFLNAVSVKVPGIVATIRGGDRIPSVGVSAIHPVNAADSLSDWTTDAQGRPLLTLHLAATGDFSNYTLTLAGAPALDARFSSTVFSFKALCPTDFDCAPQPVVCPPDDSPLPPIDYTAKDFQSFRQALTDFSALRYPGWQERSEADFGMMFAEVLSAVGDELSYLQDRVAAEATLETATQRRSLVSLARLVDYEPAPAISATTTLLCAVTDATTSLPSGVSISALGPDGSSVPFEVGHGLADTSSFVVSSQWNFPLVPYWWDDSQRCLPRGSTDMWIVGQGFGFSVFDPASGALGTALLIETDLPGQTIREVVHLTAAVEEVDHLFPPGGQTLVTHLFWAPAEALQHDHDLTATFLGGNLVPATQGQRFSERFAIPADTNAGDTAPPNNVPLAIARHGPNSAPAQPVWVFRWPLDQSPLAWLASGDPTLPPQPELLLSQQLPDSLPWTFETSLINAEPGQTAFTLDPVSWVPVAFDATGTPIAFDIDGDQGTTIRFGDGVFGVEPPHGGLFEVTYRVGLGATGNVAADAITLVDPSWSALLKAARNPFAVTTGADAETPLHIVRSAPQAFQAQQFRAVRAEDYEAAAETLPWVLKAGTSFRWTGSWLTVFTAVDPRGATPVTNDDELDLIKLLNRRRPAGYESFSPLPEHVSIDLRVTVCSKPEWLSNDVERGVLQRLGSSLESAERAGDFFFADHFTFGTPLFRSRLEAAIQGVPGVQGVLSIEYRLRGKTPDFVALPPVVVVGSQQILRVDNDPSFPERGTIRVIAEGGR